jgi:hypothetical protein
MGRKMAIRLAFLIIVACVTTSTWGQCAPGIPSAGNPGCIPPDQATSPYSLEDTGNPSKPAENSAAWESRWGSIALDFEKSKAGTISNSSDEQDAISIARSRCSENGGINCRTVLTYHDQCASVVEDTAGGPVTTSTASTQETATARSLAKCGNKNSCEVIYKRCSLPVKGALIERLLGNTSART